MGLFELIGEWISPGPTGSVSAGLAKSHQRPAWMIVAHAVIAAIALGVLLVFIGIPRGFGGVVSCLAYVLAGTVLRPRPDIANLGWFGGLIDNPFRMSDDINRFLAVLLILLWPGGLIGTGFLSLTRWLVAASARAP
jgi:hypothetical protein